MDNECQVMIKYPFGLSPDELKRGPKDPNRVFLYIYI